MHFASPCNGNCRYPLKFKTEDHSDEMGEHEIKPSAIFLDPDGVINKSAVREGRSNPPAKIKDFERYGDVAIGLQL